MSYTPTTKSAFSAYNSSTQTESGTSYVLEFDTLKNMTQISAGVLNIPSDCFFTVDLKNQRLSGETRFMMNYTPSSTALVKTKGAECSWNIGGGSPKGVPFVYALNRGAATYTRIDVAHFFSQSEPMGNNNRIIGLLL
jgi:hypothetical protein